MKISAIALSLLALTGCSHQGGSLTTPTPSGKVVQIEYAINIPSPTILQGLLTQYPHGIEMSPLQAQAVYDYRWAYGGSPNVYEGPVTTNPIGFNLAPLVVAPLAVASVSEFNDCAWPDEYGQCDPSVTKQWVGLFTYAVYKN